ncbi:MAG: hypothetical protein K1X72_26675 [Pyrinomonadaceae bacterium]|nr:hypothetical protein [Pyrinomonadaceae bacterium]
MKKLGIFLMMVMFMMGVNNLNIKAQTYRVNDRQIRSLLTRIQQRTDTFKYQINRSFNGYGLNNSRSQNYINQTVSDFENSTDRLRQDYNTNSINSDEVREVLRRAYDVDQIMRQYSFNGQVLTSWNAIKTDLNQLARYSNVSWNWNNNNYPGNYPMNNFTGTYRLNLNESDNLNSVIDQSLTGASSIQRERMRDNLERRLAVPEYLSIERSGNSVSIASSNAARTSFEANGRRTSETMPNGKVMFTTATFYGNRLEVNTDGDRINGFYISFEPFNNGEKLRVTRRLNLENRNQTITVISVYNRTSNVAQWDINRNGNTNDNGNYGNFYVPNGTRLTAYLDNYLSTSRTSEGERFRLIVNQPSAYQGAVIEGTVDKIESSGRISGRSQMNLNFETIRLRNGNTYRFEGLIDRIVTQDGKTINIDNEAAIQGSNQTTNTAVRSGIGAAIGAIIGGIAGGGKGAAIGAVIGAGAGGGSVLIQGRDNLELNSGTTFELTSSSPANVAYRQ